MPHPQLIVLVGVIKIVKKRNTTIIVKGGLTIHQLVVTFRRYIHQLIIDMD